MNTRMQRYVIKPFLIQRVLLFLFLIIVSSVVLPVEAKAGNDEKLQKIIQELKNPDREARNNAVSALGRNEYENSKKALSALLDALQEEDGDLDMNISYAIGWVSRDASILDEANTEKFKQILRMNKKAYVLRPIVETIGRIGNSGFTPVLIEVLKHGGDEYLQQSAGKSIAAIGDKGSIPILVGLLKEPKAVVSKNDFKNIVKNVDGLWDTLIKKGFIEANGIVLDKIWESFVFSNDADISLIASEKEARQVEYILIGKVLSDADQYVQGAAAEALKGLGEKPAIGAISEILNMKSHRFTNRYPAKEAAIDALLALEDKATLFPKLIHLLNDPAVNVREKAVFVLGDFGIADRSVLLPALVEKLKGQGSDFTVIHAAIQSLLKIGDVSVVPDLIDLVEHNREGGYLAAWALGEMGDKRAIPVLQKMSVEGPSPDYKERCKEALKTLEKKLGQPGLTKHLVQTTGDKLEKSRSVLEAATRVSDCEKWLSHSDMYVRAAAAVKIASFSRNSMYESQYRPSNEVMDQLAKMAKKEEPLVMIRAAEAYLCWYDCAKVEVLGEIIGYVVDSLDNPDEDVRQQADELCGMIISVGNYHEIKILGEKFIDALMNNIKKTKNDECRAKARSFLGSASYFFRSKRALDFSLADEASVRDSAYSPYEIIKLLNAKEYIPNLKQKLQGSNEEMKQVIKTTLMSLGVDVYKEDDLSSPDAVVVNFWKMIEQGKLDKAGNMLDVSRLDKEAVEDVISDHKAALKRGNFYQLEFNFNEAPFNQGIFCLPGEGYGVKKFGNCLEDVYIVNMKLYNGSNVDYYLKQQDGKWLIHEIEPKISIINK